MASTSFNPNAPVVKLVSANAEETLVFVDALSTNTTTINLDIRHSKLNADGIERIATALKVNTTLASLRLTCASSSFIDVLAINSTLVSLKASRSTHLSTASVAQKIAAVLEVNSTLKTLSLMWCGIEDASAVALTRTLGINSTLTSLNLRGNKISAEGAVEMSKALSLNTTLTEMNFAINESIKDVGASALIDAAIMNPSLTSLDIGWIGLKLASIPKIAELIQSTSSLRILDITCNPLTMDMRSLDTTLTNIRDAFLLNATITSFYAIEPYVFYHTTDTSSAINNACLRNKHNLEQKGLSLFELLQRHVIKLVPEEDFPIPETMEPEKRQTIDVGLLSKPVKKSEFLISTSPLTLEEFSQFEPQIIQLDGINLRDGGFFH